MPDAMKFEVYSMQLGDEEDRWVGHVTVTSSGGILRTIYITNGTHETRTKAENAAVVEFASRLSLALGNG